MWRDFYTTLLNAQVQVSAYEIMTVLVLLSLCLLFRVNRLGLLVSFIFAYRLGWVVLEQTQGAQHMMYLPWYWGFGFVMVAFFIYALFRSED